MQHGQGAEPHAHFLDAPTRWTCPGYGWVRRLCTAAPRREMRRRIVAMPGEYAARQENKLSCCALSRQFVLSHHHLIYEAVGRTAVADMLSNYWRD